MILDDGTVIPSYLGVQTRGSSAGSQDILNDYVLRLGEVKKIIAPSDVLSYSKKVTEYELAVQYRDGTGAVVTSTYRGATVNNLFGGVADLVSYTLRPDPKNTDASGKIFGVGSKVLILCVSGDQQKAVILGGIRDTAQETAPYNGDTGHNLYFEFNGLRFQINDDGEATVMFRGKTKNDGTLADSADPAAEGTKVNFNKDGNLEIATPNQDQLIRIDHKNKKIEIVANSEWNIQVAGNHVQNVGGDSTTTVNGTTTLDSGDNIILTSPGVHVGAATDAWVKGTTYRNAESQMHQQMDSLLMNISIQLTAATALNATPVIGGLLAATNFGAAAAMFQVLSTFIKTFEAQSSSYLSSKNLTD